VISLILILDINFYQALSTYIFSIGGSASYVRTQCLVFKRSDRLDK